MMIKNYLYFINSLKISNSFIFINSFLFLIFFLIILNILFLIFPQKKYILNYKNLNYYILFKIFNFLKLNKIFLLYFLEFCIILLIIITNICLLKNFIYSKNNNLKKIIFILMHLSFIFFISLYFKKNFLLFKYILKSKILFFNKIENKNFNVNLWIPEGWNINKFILKDNNNFYLLKSNFFINFNKVYKYHDLNNKNRYLNNIIIFLKKNYYLKYKLKINEFLLKKNFLIKRTDNKSLIYADLFFFFNKNKKINRVNIKTFLNNTFNIPSFSKYVFFNLKGLEEKNFIFNNINNLSFIERVLLNIKLIFLNKKLTFSLGPYLRFLVNDFKRKNSYEILIYMNKIKYKDFKYMLIGFKNANKIFFYKLPLMLNKIKNFVGKKELFVTLNNFFKKNLIGKFRSFKPLLLEKYLGEDFSKIENLDPRNRLFYLDILKQKYLDFLLDSLFKARNMELDLVLEKYLRNNNFRLNNRENYRDELLNLNRGTRIYHFTPNEINNGINFLILNIKNKSTNIICFIIVFIFSFLSYKWFSWWK